MSVMTIFHGPNHIINKSVYSFGKVYNDYGQACYYMMENDMYKAQSHTLYKLSKVLCCEISNLLEKP